MMRVRTILFLSVVLVGVLSCGVSAQRDAFVDQVSERVDVLMTLEPGADRKAVEARYLQLVDLANYVSAHAGVRQVDAMVRAEGAVGVFELVVTSRIEDPAGVLGRLVEHQGFATELGLLVKPQDMARNVLVLADELMKTRSAQVERYPALAAAICVVHDDQSGEVFKRRVNENSPEAPDPIAIFDYFVLNANAMAVPPDRLPALALVFVVDVTESPEELQWALNRYRSNPSIGDRFFEIEYDLQHFQQNKPKKVSVEPGDFNLQKIKRYGGVCADQAYFAMSVAKACGIPSAYVSARGADVSHAWVGFVEMRGRRAEWNFDAGRYPEYQNLRGSLVDPQTLERISDGRAGVLGGAMSASNEQALASLAAAQVVERMREGYWKSPEGMELETRGNSRAALTDSVEDQLTLLRSTLSKCSGVPRAWDQVVELAEAGKLDEKQMDVWARAVMQLAGRQHQDFAYDFLMRLIVTVDEAKRQHEMLEWAFGQFRARPDLAAGVRFQQGYLWSENDNQEYAWLAYQDVVDKFINDGPMVVTALGGMKSMLDEAGKSDQIIPILEGATRRVERPGDMSTQFATQSNFFRIHMMLATAYQQAGRTGDAQRIKTMLGV